MARAPQRTAGDHRAWMTPQLIELTSTSMHRRAALARALLVWRDDAQAQRSWAATLAGEGLSVETRAADDVSLPTRLADAWVLHINTGLSANLGRLRALQALNNVPSLMRPGRPPDGPFDRQPHLLHLRQARGQPRRHPAHPHSA